MRPLFWQQIVISSSCTNNMPFWCWPRSWAYYTVWLWAMLLMFHRYKLTPVSWSKCVRLLNFSVYNMYVEVWKRWGGGDDRRVGVGSIICTKRYSKLGKLCNQHFQGLQSAAENNWQLMFPSNHQTKYSSPPQNSETQPPIYTQKFTHFTYIDHEDGGSVYLQTSATCPRRHGVTTQQQNLRQLLITVKT